ncbi:MAG: hypothetical protein ACLT33_01600 [Lachnospira pectinoschiza]
MKPKILFAEVCEKYGFRFWKRNCKLHRWREKICKCLDSKITATISTDRQMDRQAVPYACYMASC